MSTLENVGEAWQRASASRLTKWNGSLAIVLAALGLVLSLQWKTDSDIPATDSSARSIANNTIQRLEEDQKNLKARVGSLQKQIQGYQQLAGSRNENLAGISKDLERQKALSGIVDLDGPGLKVVLDDSNKNPGQNDDPSHYIIHEYQLRDVINLLWRAGAEAISVNDERLIGTSSIYCVGSTIMVNSTRMSPPYEIHAIGNSSSLEDTMNNPNFLRKFKSEAKQYGLVFTIQRVKDLHVVAYNGVFTVKFMAPSSQQ